MSEQPSLRDLRALPEAYRPCPFCGGDCLHGNCAVVFTPIADCEHKDPIDGCCRNPKNMTPECHVAACPRLHRRIKV